MKEKVVLAYSGGLDTTAIIPWLKETFSFMIFPPENLFSFLQFMLIARITIHYI